MAAGLVACQEPDTEESAVQGRLAGTITVNPQVDSVAEYSGFEVLVIEATGREIDTLGYAVTGPDGSFATDVLARDRGIYLLMVRRRGATLLRSEYVVADGDTAEMNVELPYRRPRLPVRSDENSALSAYRNTMGLHRQALTRRLQRGQYDQSSMVMNVRQTSSILWDLQDSYDGTYAADLASVESLALLEGWNDSLVVARAQQIAPSNPRYVAAGRIARRAMARFQGQDASVQLLNDFVTEAATPDQRAALRAEVVRAYVDSLDRDRALAAAEELISEHNGTRWADWAERTVYEVENLMPGMDAPELAVQTMSGDPLTLDDLRGYLVVLEFFRPGNDMYQQQIPTRNALYEATRTDSVAFVSVSVEPDTLLNRAFFEGRTLPGAHVIAPNGPDDPIIETYNVATVPTRYLIDREGKIVDKYPGASFFAMQDAVTERLSQRPARRISPQTPPTSEAPSR